MTKSEREFSRRIKAIYAKVKPGESDQRPAELEAMLDVFLGRSYEKRVRREIAMLQSELHRGQEDLAAELAVGKLAPAEYVDSINRLVDETFAKCEKLLGRKNFEKLFGSPPSKGGLADRAAFIESRSAR